MLRYPTVHLVERLPTISHTAICEIEFVVSDCKKKIWIGRNHPQKNNLHLFPMDWVQGCMGMTEKCNNTT